MSTLTQVSSWRAIEALRAGVPNRDAVQALGIGSAQPNIEARFRDMLSTVTSGATGANAVDGILVAGDFGAGKSHLLEYLQHVALENNFVCSKVVISKETPLYDTSKVYSSAIQSARVPDRAGTILSVLAVLLACAALLALLKRGTAMAAMMPMITRTITNSTKLKATRRLRRPHGPARSDRPQHCERSNVIQDPFTFNSARRILSRALFFPNLIGPHP